jgi:anhydro-N-acetylmuramic acid kinase
MTHALVVQKKNTKIAMVSYYLGLMSGTSMDGVDGVIVDENCKKIIASACVAYPPELKNHLQQLSQTGSTSLADLAQADIAVAQIFSQTANQLLAHSQIDKNAILAIGSHGQTVFHQGGVYSMQIGHGALIAEQTGITTVADFRMQDVAAGGQGAPLTPFYHQHLLEGKDGVVVNLGGIANITIVKNSEVLGFDTGPANTLLDAWARQEKQMDFDKDGIWARLGKVDKVLLDALLADNYFNAPTPKSTGPEYFNLKWLSQYLNGNEKPEDVQRTLVELTAMSIFANIPKGEKVCLCGGGVHNLFLVERLVGLAPQNTIALTDDININPDSVEAAAFAYFAKQTMNGKPSNLPTVTGAKAKKILGAVYQQQYY